MKFKIEYDEKVTFELDLWEAEQPEDIDRMCNILGQCIGEVVTKICPMEQRDEAVEALTFLMRSVKKWGYSKLRTAWYMNQDTVLLDEMM